MRLQTIFLFLLCATTLHAQVTERPRPAEWDQLVPGARFIDRFQPMQGKRLQRASWGAEEVRRRLVDNGIEDPDWSFWGGNIVKGDDGKYHLFVAAWPEASPKGHGTWPNSGVLHAVSDTPYGPFAQRDSIGKGHNPEIYRLNDGRYVLYVIGGRYIAPSLDGPWEYGRFQFDTDGKKVSEGYSNMSFTKRPQGGYLMVSRGGEIWQSSDGTDSWKMLTERVYPRVEGRFEDPVLWRDNVQYNLIVNDWLGRIAYYLRSGDGVNWVVDPGEAYTPGIARHQDGTSEEWFKYERMKVFQDEYGRAVQANFAVIDTLKNEDKSHDRHSSKNITIPLNPGMLLSIEGPEAETIRVRIQAEKGFRPNRDVDLGTLRFGASSEVNYGRGAKVLKKKRAGKDLIVTFATKDCGLTPEEFAPKMIGRSNKGDLLYGFAKREVN